VVPATSSVRLYEALHDCQGPKATLRYLAGQLKHCLPACRCICGRTSESESAMLAGERRQASQPPCRVAALVMVPADIFDVCNVVRGRPHACMLHVPHRFVFAVGEATGSGDTRGCETVRALQKWRISSA